MLRYKAPEVRGKKAFKIMSVPNHSGRQHRGSSPTNHGLCKCGFFKEQPGYCPYGSRGIYFVPLQTPATVDDNSRVH